VRRFAIHNVCYVDPFLCRYVLRTHDTSPLTNEVLKEKTLVAVLPQLQVKLNDFQLSITVVSFVSDRLVLPSEPSNAIDLFRCGRRLQ
jgi:hypothetical protein